MKKIYFGMLQRIYVCIILVLSVTMAFAQSRTITGRVTDPANGTGISGVSVTAKGSTAGAVTNADGSLAYKYLPVHRLLFFLPLAMENGNYN
jgi:hypothetical protein